MALVTVEGVYENGKVELMEKPEGVEKAKVMVTFLPDTHSAQENERKIALRQRFLARLQRGVDFGTEPLPTREELYADRLDRF